MADGELGEPGSSAPPPPRHTARSLRLREASSRAPPPPPLAWRRWPADYACKWFTLQCGKVGKASFFRKC